MAKLIIEVQEAPNANFNCDQLIVAKFKNGTVQNVNDVLNWNDFTPEEQAKIVETFEIIQTKIQ